MKKALSYLLVSFSILASCTKEAKDVENAVEVPWEICATKAGVVEKATYRACLFSADGKLSSEGTYCGYQNPKGWLYPCGTNDNGDALDSDGNPVSWEDAQWSEKIDKDSKYALKAKSDNNVYSLVLLSPALKNNQTEDNVSYLPIDRREEPGWKASKAVNVRTTGVTVDGSYVYDLSSNILYEQRSKVTVKIACGKADYTEIVSVYFKDVISSAKYLPLTSEYRDAVLDGGSETPLADYYTTNSYPSEDGNSAGEGEKFVSPEATSVKLVHKAGIGTDEKQWWTKFSDEDEWKRGTDDGRGSMLTAIKDFYILPLEYSKEEGGELYYKDMVPEIVVTEKSKIDGKDKKITLQLAVNVEPMKNYTIYLFVSNIDVQVTLVIENWKLWDDGLIEKELEVMFGHGVANDGKLCILDCPEVDISTTISNPVWLKSDSIDPWNEEGTSIEF